MRIYPAAGLKVRDPATRLLLPEEGLDVPDHDLFWARLLSDGDVTHEKPQSPSAAAAEEPQPTPEAAAAEERA